MQKTDLHHFNLVVVNSKSMMVRFEQPIVAIKHIQIPPELPKDVTGWCKYRFKLTGAATYLVSMPEEKEQGKTKCVWAIEMNETRDV